jgi:nitrate reductase beta subunit
VAQGLMVLMGSTDRIMHRFQVEKGMATGFNEAGTELVRVPVTEPVVERPAYDERVGSVRHNTP